MGVIDKIAIDLSTKLGDKLQKSIEEKAVLRYGKIYFCPHTYFNSNNTYNINWDINRNDSRNNNNIYNRCMV